MKKRILFVSRGRVTAYVCDPHISEPLEFLADEEGLRNFELYVQQFPKEPTYILVDVVEEEFREDTVPHVSGRDRQAMIRNKLNRSFRDSTFSAALFLERSREGRRDDRMLFTALTRPEMLTPWTSILAENKVAVAGVFSIPYLGEPLISGLKIKATHVVLVSVQAHGGLRQSFFFDGQLKLSRLALLGDLRSEQAAPALLAEVERLRRYLNSLRTLPSSGALDVVVLCSPRLERSLHMRIQDTPTTHYHIVKLEDAAKKLKYKNEYADAFADRLFVHMLAKKTPATQYAPKATVRYFKHLQAKRFIYGLSSFGLLLLLAGSAFNFVNGLDSRGDANTTKRQAAFYQDRYEKARKRLPETPADTREMKLVVEAASKLARYKSSPLDLFATVSDALAASKRIELDSIEWLVSPNAAALTESRRRNTSRRDERSDSQEPFALYQLARLRGRIEPFAGDYREALALVREFESALETVPGVIDVTVESMPLDIGSEARLSGDASDVTSSASRAEGASFVLRVSIQTAGDAVESAGSLSQTDDAARARGS